MMCRSTSGACAKSSGGDGVAADDSESVYCTNRRPCKKFQFNRKQLLALASMLLVDLGAYATMSIMAPFFPHQVSSFIISLSVCNNTNVIIFKTGVAFYSQNKFQIFTVQV